MWRGRKGLGRVARGVSGGSGEVVWGGCGVGSQAGSGSQRVWAMRKRKVKG